MKENLLVNKKIVISGGPGSGKTTLINLLINNGYHCFEEFSRSVIDAGKAKGIQNFFETEPLIFSEIIFQERKKQYLSAPKIDHLSVFPYVFFDRGLHDIIAYLDHQGNPADEMSIEIQNFNIACKNISLIFIKMMNIGWNLLKNLFQFLSLLKKPMKNFLFLLLKFLLIRQIQE